MKIDLTGTNVLVTGASRGIGREIARHMAGSGARVGIHYHLQQGKAVALAEELGHGCQVFAADLEDPSQCVGLFNQAKACFGTIDVLVNNAGVFLAAPIGEKNDLWLQKWQKTIQINLTSAALLCKAAINHFVGHRGGRIINIASRAAFRGDDPDYFAYAASKGGMVSLTRSIARGFGKKNIKAFLIAPGFVRTDMAQEFFDIYGEEDVVKTLALNSLTEPGDVAPLVVFLASGLGDHATGGTFDINAGSYVH